MIVLRAFWARDCFFGSICESSRVLSDAITEMCTSAFSTAHSVVGATQSSCSSLASSKKAACAPLGWSCMIGRPPARRISS